MDFHTDLPLRLMFRTAHTHTAPIEPQQITIHTTSTGYGGKPMGNAFGHPHPRPGRVEGCVQVRCWEPAPLAADLERLGAAEPTRGLRQLVQALRPDVQAAFLRYRPLELSSERWEKARPLAEDAVALIAPACRYLAARLLVVVTPFVDWMITVNGYPPYPRTLFHPAMIRRYITRDDVAWTASTRRTYRSLLMRISDALIPAAPDLVFPATAAQTTAAPYSDLDLHLLEAWARGQATAARRRSASAVLGLCAGAGLRAGEVLRVRRTDITVDTLGITVAAGEPARVVPVLRRFEPLLLDAIADIAADAWVFGSAARVKHGLNTLNTFLRDTARGQEPDPVTTRMRNTWIITHLTLRTDLRALMSAAGVTRFENLDQLTAHVPPLTPAVYRQQLRAEIAR